MASLLERVEITDPTDLTVDRAADFPRLAEAAGLDGVGMRDHQHSGRDVYARITVAAMATSRVSLFPCVTNPLTRHPTVLASIANSMEEMAPGRFRLVVGAGDQSAQHIGRPAATVAELRGAVEMLRSLLAGHATAIGASQTEQMANVSPRPVPVHVNASSPKMVRMAGEVADGVLLMVGRHPNTMAAAGEALREGAALAGRAVGDLGVTYALPTFIDSTTERARQRARVILGFWLARPARIFTRHAKATGASEAALLDGMGLVGTAEECAEQLREFAEQPGAPKHVVCQLYGGNDDQRGLLDAFERTILPRVK